MILVSVSDLRHAKLERRVPVAATAGCDAFATALDMNSSIQTIRLDGNGTTGGEQRTQTALREREGRSAHAA
jgi:hypothetical protein